MKLRDTGRAEESFSPPSPPPHPFVRKVEGIALFTLSGEERAALANLPMHVVTFPAGQDIVREGDRPSRSFAVLEGFVAIHKVTEMGHRQVMAYQVPGDVPDFQSLHLRVLDFNISTITPCRIGFVEHDVVRKLFSDHPRLGDVFWRATLIEAAMLREWMLNNSQRDAYARLAHLFCELLVRLEVVGLAEDHSCAFPLTQVELGDALGLSTVHVNRTLQALRGEGLLTLGSGRLTVNDWPRLKAAAGFDPSYLHLPRGTGL
jgi:CRP-like cAMP-binding protein